MKSSHSERRVVPRGGSRVIHAHWIGRRHFRRVSELVFVRGKPFAVLDWMDLTGDRIPIYLPLDSRKLRSPRGVKNIYYYDGTTSDPRFEDLVTTAGG